MGHRKIQGYKKRLMARSFTECFTTLSNRLRKYLLNDVFLCPKGTVGGVFISHHLSVHPCVSHNSKPDKGNLIKFHRRVKGNEVCCLKIQVSMTKIKVTVEGHRFVTNPVSAMT